MAETNQLLRAARQATPSLASPGFALSRAELVRRTGAGDRRVQAALDELVKGAFVVRRPQDAGPVDYEITAAGSGRLELVGETLRKFLLTLWNTYAFFVTYATLDEWAPADTTPASTHVLDPHVLDRWVRSRLHSTVATVGRGMAFTLNVSLSPSPSENW